MEPESLTDLRTAPSADEKVLSHSLLSHSDGQSFPYTSVICKACIEGDYSKHLDPSRSLSEVVAWTLLRHVRDISERFTSETMTTQITSSIS